MPNWNEFHGWMAFDQLDEMVGLTRAFTIGYRFSDCCADVWTHRFNQFKNKQRTALRGGSAVIKNAIPDLLDGLGLNASNTTFVPALSSNETVASDRGVLWRMTEYCARFAKAGFVGNAVLKNAHEPLHMNTDSNKRQEILDGANFTSGKIAADVILIFDDFITRGATMSHIARAILEVNKDATIYGVALGKADRRNYWKKFDIEVTNDHVPLRWDEIWKIHEQGK